MPAVAPTGTNVEVIVQGVVSASSGSNKTIVNTFHLQSTNYISAPSETNIWTMFAGAWWVPTTQMLSVAWVGQQSTVRFMDDALRIPVVTGVPANGTQALPRLDTALAAVFLLRTGLRGKTYRGFKHIGPLPTAFATGDELNAGTGLPAAATLLAAYQTFATEPVTGNTYRLSVFSRKLSQVLVNPTSIVNNVQNGTGRFNKTLGTMRHRKEKTNF